MGAFITKLSGGIAATRRWLGDTWRGPYWWVVPILILLVPLVLGLALLQTVSVFVPFVYTVF